MSGFNLAFTPPKEVETKFGRRVVQSAYPNEEFWSAWRKAKDSLRSMGFAVTRDHENRWVVHLWREAPPELPKPPPEVVGYELRQTKGLLPYQVPHAAAICAALHKYGSALDASDTGTGKTYSAVAVARELGLIPAVVCPISVMESWRRVLALFGIEPHFVMNWEGCKSKRFAHGDLLMDGSYRWKLGRKILLIFDEAHKAKGEYTQNAKMVIAARKQEIPMLLCSATIASTPREMRAMGYALGLHALHDFRSWSLKLGCYQNQWNGWECSDPKTAMKEVSAELFPAKGNRMRIAELGDAFPDCQISADVYTVKNSDAQNKEYAKLLAEIEKLKAKKERNIQAAALTLNLRYRQLAENLKIDLLEELALDYAENGLSVAVFVNFTATLEDLSARLKGAVVVHGQQSATERQASIDAFQENRTRFIVLNAQAGGTGISLHDLHGGHPRVGLICPTYSATVLKQILGRIHRAGGQSKALYRLIYAKGTVEEKVCRSVAHKLDAIATLNDGDMMEPDVLGVLGK